MFEEMFKDMIELYIKNKVDQKINEFCRELREQLNKNMFPKDIATGVKMFLKVVESRSEGIKDYD